MKSYIIENFVNSRKLAVLEDGELEDFIIEDYSSNESINNIYRGRITKILKNLDSCFVDLGGSKTGYLRLEKGSKFKEGDNVLVELIKEGVGEKKPTLSLEISLSGRYLIYIPSNDRITFSNKISDKEEKNRLYNLLLSASQDERGFILRTESIGASFEQLKNEIDILRKRYKSIMEEFNREFNPRLIYKDCGKIENYIYEHFNSNVSEIVYSCEGFHDRIRSIIKNIDIRCLEVLDFQRGVDVFESYGVNNLLKKYINRKIWLRSGISIVIDKTEAMTVIDVNMGRFTGVSDHEDSVYKANELAAMEIMKQIKIRDISGIIIIDFISMKSEINKYKLVKLMKSGLLNQGRVTKVYGLTNLGLMEISRSRQDSSLYSYYLENPIFFEDNYSLNYWIDRIEQEVLYSKNHRYMDEVEMSFPNAVALALRREKSAEIRNIEEKYGVKITLCTN